MAKDFKGKRDQSEIRRYTEMVAVTDSMQNLVDFGRQQAVLRQISANTQSGLKGLIKHAKISPYVFPGCGIGGKVKDVTYSFKTVKSKV
jgi:hypothetical protein